jgi:hypothetical protein
VLRYCQRVLVNKPSCSFSLGTRPDSPNDWHAPATWHPTPNTNLNGANLYVSIKPVAHQTINIPAQILKRLLKSLYTMLVCSWPDILAIVFWVRRALCIVYLGYVDYWVGVVRSLERVYPE